MSILIKKKIDKLVKKRRDDKLFRRKLRSKEKQRNLRRNGTGKTKAERKFLNKFRDYVIIKAPINFSFIKETEGTILFIQKIEKCFQSRNRLFLDLENTEILDHSAIIVLLSVMNLFRSKRIGFDGSYPLNKDAAILLYNSGFLKSLYTDNKRLKYVFGKKNQMFTQENKKVISELGLPLMIEVGSTIYGEKRIFKGLQRVLLELMQNTNNHAVFEDKGQKNWWLSVNHDKKNKKVTFSFVDYGIGIFESLKNKPQNNKWYNAFDKIKHLIRYGENNKILEMLLSGELHMTVTGHHFRGKGLPGINQVLERNQISKLFVVTNDAYAKVHEGKYLKLQNHFSGTFVSWEINDSNISTEWSIL